MRTTFVLLLSAAPRESIFGLGEHHTIQTSLTSPHLMVSGMNLQYIAI